MKSNSYNYWVEKEFRWRKQCAIKENDVVHNTIVLTRFIYQFIDREIQCFFSFPCLPFLSYLVIIFLSCCQRCVLHLPVCRLSSVAGICLHDCAQEECLPFTFPWLLTAFPLSFACCISTRVFAFPLSQIAANYIFIDSANIWAARFAR